MAHRGGRPNSAFHAGTRESRAGTPGPPSRRCRPSHPGSVLRSGTVPQGNRAVKGGMSLEVLDQYHLVWWNR
ncbi:hypothetical protein AV530_011646 [Patagioenas fasciata monilis]|uniref:Uncharacterized protein n=1 Tax=Patagioenas fasciata monilis TaxID=372326 RepID=A0A1V4J568_PATFA|nr:hypothetical protein AV530_011646 [Patagioenas fasciata monilis]